MNLAAIYARVSTARQEEEQTIKTQLSAVNEFVQKRSFTVVEEYIDEGWSGDILARPALDKLRQDAKSKRWQTVVIYDPDRLARRYSYQELVMDELREAGIEVVFVTISTPKNSEDKILYGVRGLFAEYERAKIGERFRLGKVRKIKEGHILVSEPLYGYRYIRKDDKRPGYYEINEEEAGVMRMIFDWVDQRGWTIRKIIRELDSMGIKPRKSKRGVWATSTLSKLLKNRAYIGEAHWGSSYAVVPENPLKKEKYRKNKKTSRRMRPESEWFTVPVPSIVAKDVFARVQERIRANFLLSQRNTKNEYLLAGKVFCSCGKRRAGEGPQRGKHLYYRCNDRVLSFPLPRTCHEKALNARLADRLVWNAVANLMTSRELLYEQIERWRQKGSQKSSSKVDTEALNREILVLRAQEERYNKAYGAGLFEIEQLKEYVSPVRHRIAAFEAKVREFRDDEREKSAPEFPNEQQINEFAEHCRRFKGDLKFPAKREIISNVVEKVIGTKERLQIYGFIPVTNVNVCTSDRHRQDTPCNDRHLSQTIPFELEIAIPQEAFGRSSAAKRIRETILRNDSNN